MKRIVLLAMFLSIAVVTATSAYEVIDVKNGGSIKGKVKVAAKYESPVLKIEKDVEFCGNSQPSNMYLISGDMGIKNVLVIVENVTKGKAAPKADTTVDNKKCYFEPLVSIAFKGSNYILKNSDPILHNTSLAVMLGDKRRTVYNLALPKKDQVITKPVRVTGLHDVKCDAHSWMRAYVYVSEHPYVAITDNNGNFEIKDLPPGKYTVRFWHEGLKEEKKEVEVSAGKASDLNITMSKK